MGCRLRGQFRSFGSTEAVPPHGSAKRRVTGRPRVIRRRRILPGAAPPPFLSRQPEAGSAPQSRGPEVATPAPRAGVVRVRSRGV